MKNIDVIELPRNPYFTLPIAIMPALEGADDYRRLAGDLISYGVIGMGNRLIADYGGSGWMNLETDPIAKSGERLIDRIGLWKSESRATDYNTKRDLPFALGAWYLNIGAGGSLGREVTCASRADAAIAKHHRGSGALVSFKTDYLFDLRDGKMPLDDFLVLAAIRSILGRNPRSPRRITRNQIAARIEGYGSARDVPPAIASKVFDELRLQRISRIAQKLSKRGIFGRFTDPKSKRETFYHNSWDMKRIMQWVKARNKKRQEKRIAEIDNQIEIEGDSLRMREIEYGRRAELKRIRARRQELESTSPSETETKVVSIPMGYYEVPSNISATGRVYMDEFYQMDRGTQALIAERGNFVPPDEADRWNQSEAV